MKKLASQHFSRKNGNESIMVTTRFLARILAGPDGPFGFWTFLKCPKSSSEKQT
jgi:hypothetical protein